MKMDRSQGSLHDLHEVQDERVSEKPEELVAMIWELTAEVWSLMGAECVERRLQRHVAHLDRS